MSRVHYQLPLILKDSENVKRFQLFDAKANVWFSFVWKISGFNSWCDSKLFGFEGMLSVCDWDGRECSFKHAHMLQDNRKTNEEM